MNSILASLVFSDLGLGDQPFKCWFKSTPETLNVEVLPQDMLKDAENLFSALEANFAHSRKTGFMMIYTSPITPPDENIETKLTLRVERMSTVSGPVYVCRRFSLIARRLSDLGFPSPIAQILLSPDFKDGLVAFCGKVGSGKTTTAYTYMKERLNTLGGVLLTLENPPEMQLTGRHGNGVCYQIDVSDDDDMGGFTPSLLRATPNVVYYGEIRTAETLREALKLALTGHLVIVTLHAGDLVSCMTRMNDFVDGDSALLSETLRAVLHLELRRLDRFTPKELQELKPTGNPPRVLAVSSLILDEQDSELKSILRDKQYHLLKNVIEKMRRQMMSANSF